MARYGDGVSDWDCRGFAALSLEKGVNRPSWQDHLCDFARNLMSCSFRKGGLKGFSPQNSWAMRRFDAL